MIFQVIKQRTEINRRRSKLYAQVSQESQHLLMMFSKERMKKHKRQNNFKKFKTKAGCTENKLKYVG
jgi:hypothetical protein